MALNEDPLFLAMTRPSMFAGLPLEAAMSVLSTGVVVVLVVSNPLYAAAVAGAAYGIARAVVRYDVNMFRLIGLWFATSLKCRTRKFWGGSSYSPTRTIGTKRRGFGRV